MATGSATNGLAFVGTNDLVRAAVVGGSTPTNRFGYSLVWANTDGSGQLDLAIGSPGMPVSVNQKEGRVVIAHAAVGVLPKDWAQGSFYDPTRNDLEEFGYAVAKAKRIGTFLDDLIIGAPHANIPGYADAGEAFAWNY